MKERVRSHYAFHSPKIPHSLRFAVAPDLHSAPFEDVLEDFSQCDAVLIPGDLIDRHRRNNANAYRFLRDVPEIVPVFFSLGNHETKYRRQDDFLTALKNSGVTLLDNEWTSFRGILIGGLSCAKHEPDVSFVQHFEKQSGFRLLLCHQPEVWRSYIRGRDIDLTLCGHAHGGQIQIGGRGLYAPGQGLFPKMTNGLYGGGAMLLSRGMTNGAKPRIPRINNPCELVIIDLEKDEGGTAP